MSERFGCLALFLKTILLFCLLWVIWGAFVYFGFGWFSEWTGFQPSVAWERDNRYFAALGTIPPLLITLIWLAFAAARARRRR